MKKYQIRKYRNGEKQLRYDEDVVYEKKKAREVVCIDFIAECIALQFVFPEEFENLIFKISDHIDRSEIADLTPMQILHKFVSDEMKSGRYYECSFKKLDIRLDDRHLQITSPDGSYVIWYLAPDGIYNWPPRLEKGRRELMI